MSSDAMQSSIGFGRETGQFMPYSNENAPAALFLRQLQELARAVAEGRYEHGLFMLNEISVGVELLRIRPEFRAALKEQGIDPDRAATEVLGWLRGVTAMQSAAAIKAAFAQAQGAPGSGEVVVRPGHDGARQRGGGTTMES